MMTDAKTTSKAVKAVKATKAPAVKATKKEVAPKDTKNSITRPSEGTATGKVWEIADELSTALKAPVDRKALIEATTKAKLNPSTAATQYGRWRKYNGLTGTGKEATSKTKEAA